jgi:hypothetical protein
MVIMSPQNLSGNLWYCLENTKGLQFTGPSGAGIGIVTVTSPAEGVLLFVEKGTWKTNLGVALTFFNTFRWTRKGQDICLEHLRLGPNHPVFLFVLTPLSENSWESVAGHP